MFAVLHQHTPLNAEALDRFTAACTGDEADRIYLSADRQLAIKSRNPLCLPEDHHDAPPYRLGEWHIVAYARLDNRDELLASLAPETTPLSDSTLLARAWAEWGEAGLSRIYGNFALAAWHAGQRCLYLAVDHLGHWPLYYFHSPELRLASSRRQVLLAHPAVPKTLNAMALAELVSPWMPDAEPWCAIERVPAGHVLQLPEHGPIRRQRWWQPPSAHSVYFRDPRDYSAALQPSFDRAVKCLLRSSAGIASTLSGGLDSSLATAYAARHLRERQQTLTAYTSVPEAADYQHVARPHWDIDEWALTAELAAHHPNIYHRAIRAGEENLLQRLMGQHQHNGTPLRNSANYAWLEMIAQQAQAAQQKILLVGARGNASLSYAGHQGLNRLLARGQWRWLAQHLRALSPRQCLRALAELGGVNSLRRHIASRRPTLPPGITPEWLAPAWRRPIRFTAPTVNLRDWPQRVQFLIQPRAAYAPDFLNRYGVMLVDPFANRALIEQLLSYPPEAFVGLGFERLPARLLGEGLVPDSIRWRTRRGEQAPDENYWIQRHAADYRAHWQRLRQHDAVLSLLDRSTIDALVDSACHQLLPRSRTAALHRILDIALFIEYSERHWGARLDFTQGPDSC